MTALNATQEISVNMNNLPNNLKSIWQTWQWRRKNNLSFWFCLSRERKTEAKGSKKPLSLKPFYQLKTTRRWNHSVTNKFRPMEYNWKFVPRQCMKGLQRKPSLRNERSKHFCQVKKGRTKASMRREGPLFFQLVKLQQSTS